MDWTTLVATVGTVTAAVGGAAAVLAALSGWLGRVWAKRIAQDERAKLEADLETLKHALQIGLEKVRSEIRSGEEQLNAVRATALQAVSCGTTALIQRRLDATDVLWRAVSTMKQGGMVAQMVGALNIQNVEANRKDAGVQALLQFLEKIADQFVASANTNLPGGAESARPYVTPMAWALYAAYSGIVMDAVITLKALIFGTPLRVLNSDFALDLVKAALPDAEALLEKSGRNALPKLLAQLEERLLAELRASAEGRDWDMQSASRARRVGELLAAHEVESAKRSAGV